jgi:hypothetical protein
MFDDLPFGLATLHAIVMVWISDHPAQCKVGGILGVDAIMLHIKMACSIWR